MRKVAEVKHKQICSFTLKTFFVSVIFFSHRCIVFHYHLINKHFSCIASRKLKNFISIFCYVMLRGCFSELSLGKPCYTCVEATSAWHFTSNLEYPFNLVFFHLLAASIVLFIPLTVDGQFFLMIRLFNPFFIRFVTK